MSIHTVPDHCESTVLVGSTQPVIDGVPCTEYEVAGYIRVQSNWWTKPTEAQRTVSISGDSCSFSLPIATGGNDVVADQIVVALVPAGTTPPLAWVVSEVPPALEEVATEIVAIDRPVDTKTITFANRTWHVKHSCSRPLDPGPTVFDDSSAWVDVSGHLHLRCESGTSSPPSAAP